MPRSSAAFLTAESEVDGSISKSSTEENLSARIMRSLPSALQIACVHNIDVSAVKILSGKLSLRMPKLCELKVGMTEKLVMQVTFALSVPHKNKSAF